MKLIDDDGTEMQLIRYTGDDVSALYKNGKLLFASQDDVMTNRIFALCGIEIRYSEDFMLGKEVVVPGFSDDVASTIREIETFARARSDAFLAQELEKKMEADALRKQAAELLRQADEISPQ